MNRHALALCLLIASASVAFAEPGRRDAVSVSSGLTHRADGVDARRGSVLLQVTALTDEIVRVRVGRAGSLPEDASWAVLPAMRARHVAVAPIGDGFATRSLRVTVDPATLKLNVTDPAGNSIVSDADDPLSLDGSRIHLAQGDAARRAHLRTRRQDRRHARPARRSYVDWNTDAYGFDSSTDPIYKSIPFFIGIDDAGGSYGLLLDNSWRASFDFGHERADTFIDGRARRADRLLCDRRARPPRRRPPLHRSDRQGAAAAALGARFPAIALQLHERGRGADDRRPPARRSHPGRRAVARHRLSGPQPPVHGQHAGPFPICRVWRATLAPQGIKLVAITDLHVADAPNQGYAPYDSGVAGNHFVKNPDGSLFVGPVWPGPVGFPRLHPSRERAPGGARSTATFVAMALPASGTT